MSGDEEIKGGHPWYIKGAFIALMVWCILNVSVMSWQMALSVWVANAQAPQAIQQAQQKAAELQRQLDAERATKAKPAEPTK